MPRLVVAVLSDTHGLIRPEVRATVRGCDHILHAGDLEDPLAAMVLSSFAPTTAVRGNCDRRSPLPATQTIELGGRLVHLLHDLSLLDVNPVAAGIAVVISGHTHIPKCDVRDGILYFNPGSAGPVRFGKPISMGKLIFDEHGVTPELITL